MPILFDQGVTCRSWLPEADRVIHGFAREQSQTPRHATLVGGHRRQQSFPSHAEASLKDLGPVVKFACSLAFAVLAVGCADDRISPVAPEYDGVAAVGATASAAAGGQYVVLGKGNKLPAQFEDDIAAAGGEVLYSVPQIGVALVRSSSPDFATQASGIKGLDAVTADIVVQMAPTGPHQGVPEITDEGAAAFHDPGAELADPPFTDIADRFFDLQWAMDALDWTEAVEISSVRGDGVRVAILDSGILSTHNEFLSNLNVGLSTSFVPGEDFDNPAGFHGTHVSGIVAAAQNNVGTIGVAPEVDLVSVKVLSATTGGGSFAGIAAGIVYAADIEADVVNMSIGATLDHSGNIYDSECNVVDQASAAAIAATTNALKRAAQYASQNGVLLIASSGNCGTDGDTDADRIHLPSDIPHILSISATGPVGWALDPDTNLDRIASFSNYGRTVIDFAAPGGDFALPGNDVCQVLTGPTDIPLVQFCWVLDLVFSASNASPFTYSWTAGTSMAAPAATGVAALIISKNGGSMKPAHVEAAMRQAVNFDDGGPAGSTGKTAEFGHGHLSALEALR